jgi:hypothetical protein
MGKAGRKKKIGVKRINGRISQRVGDRQMRRASEEQDAMAVAREARERVFGVAIKDSIDPLAETFVGRLYLQRAVTRKQLDAAQQLHKDYVRYARTIGMPAPQPRASAFGQTGSGEPLEFFYEEKRAACVKWDAVKRIVTDANQIHRTGTLWAAVYYCVLMDQPLMHLVGDMRLALNALARHYVIGEMAA